MKHILSGHTRKQAQVQYLWPPEMPQFTFWPRHTGLLLHYLPGSVIMYSVCTTRTYVCHADINVHNISYIIQYE